MAKLFDIWPSFCRGRQKIVAALFWFPLKTNQRGGGVPSETDSPKMVQEGSHANAATRTEPQLPNPRNSQRQLALRKADIFLKKHTCLPIWNRLRHTFKVFVGHTVISRSAKHRVGGYTRVKVDVQFPSFGHVSASKTTNLGSSGGGGCHRLLPPTALKPSFKPLLKPQVAAGALSDAER